MSSHPSPPEGFYIDQRPEGPTLVMSREWKPAATEVLESGRVDGLVLGYPAGPGDDGLEFLRPWPLRRFMVIDRTISDVRPIHRLGSTLEELHVEVDPRSHRGSNSYLDLSQFPHLRRLSADWNQVSDSIPAATHLSDLTLRRFHASDLRPLAKNARLTQIDLEHYPQIRTLDGVEDLPNLAGLGIYYARKLQDITALAHCSQIALRRLELQASSGFAKVDSMGGLRALERLNLSECRDIESLAPLRPLKRLQELWMWGSTRIVDNDLSPLLALQSLVNLRMMNRRTYVPSVRDVKAYLGLGE